MEKEAILEDQLPPSIRSAIDSRAEPSVDPALQVELWKTAACFMRAVWDVCCDADSVFRHSEDHHWFGLFELIASAPSTADAVDWQKYLVAWPMARFLRQAELPPCPASLERFLGEGSDTPKFNPWRTLLSGPPRKHFRNLLNSRSTENRPMRLFHAILQGVKRGCATVPGDFQVRAMRKHQAALTQKLPVIPDEKLELFRLKFRAIFRQRGKWSGGGRVWTTYGADPRMRHFADQPGNPGFHACFEGTRGSGGRAGYVRSCLLDEAPLLGQDSFLEDWPLVSMAFSPKKGVTEDRRYLPRVRNSVAQKLALESLRNSGGKCEAQVAGCLEPLKCRLITKGSGLPYWASMPIQQAMWQKLQKYSCFDLTGRPMDGSDISDVHEKCKSLGLDFDEFVSGDYSAATDGLSQQINSLCLEEALGGVGATEAEREICRAVMGNHVIHYVRGLGKDWQFDANHACSFPGALKTEEHKIEQTNGQLMGSPLSFPILCAINLAAFWLALEEYTGRSFSIEQLPVKVNGDDILFKANGTFYPVWKKWTNLAGFTLSLGKNYISRSFVTINSEGYHADLIRGRLRLRKLGFLNLSLLYGGSRSKEIDWRETRANIAAREKYRDMPWTAKVNLCLEESVDARRTLLRVHALYRDEIRAHTQEGEFNLHAALELGGLGITLPDGCQTTFTKWQQRVAGYLHDMWKRRAFPNEVKTSDGKRHWDVTRNARIPGTIVHVLRKKVAARPEVAVQLEEIVVRPKLEPLREGEERISSDVRSLMNYQGPPTDDRGNWKVTHLSKDEREQVRKWKGPGMTQPFKFDKEIRIVRSREVACSDVGGLVAPCQDVERVESDGLVPPLRRTDSQFMATYRAPDGTFIFFPQRS
nr:MAG: putative RNA-dependent RNA polymerase [Narnaviridae sp.]